MSSGSVVHVLANSGAADKQLMKDEPGKVKKLRTLWRFVHHKHTNFATETVSTSVVNARLGTGSTQTKTTTTIPRNGDLLYRQYVHFLLPGLSYETKDTEAEASVPVSFPCAKGGQCDPCDPTNDFVAERKGGEADLLTVVDVSSSFECDGGTGPWAHWVQAIGQHLVQRAELKIGNSRVDYIEADGLYMIEELFSVQGKQLREMIGKRETRTQLIEDSKNERHLYVPLPWWFTRVSGNALPIITLQFHQISLDVTLPSLQTCIVRSGPFVKVQQANSSGGASDFQETIQMWIDSEYVYLDMEERGLFANASFEQLICQHQSCQFSDIAKYQESYQLPFNHPIIELIWRIRRRKQLNCNNMFNYSGFKGYDPIKTVGLRFNNMPRFETRDSMYFRTVQPYQHHSSVPKSYTYCYSFALNPESAHPSGSANFSRLDRVDLELAFQDELISPPDIGGVRQQPESVDLYFLARNWNIIKYKAGLGGVVYAS